MNNTQNISSSDESTFKSKWIYHAPVLVAGLALVIGSVIFGYVIGKRQGLTVTGFEMDAEQLNEVVQKQKIELETISKRFNATVQERDVAVSNANKFYQAYNDEKLITSQMENINKMYRDLLKTRGGVALTVQNVGVKSLPDNAFEYTIDLVQVSESSRKASGSVEMRLINGEDVLSVPLENKTFNFEYYERLTGRWTMPKGFTPQYVEIRLSGVNPVTKRFAWHRGKAQEITSKSISEIPQNKANSK